MMSEITGSVLRRAKDSIRRFGTTWGARLSLLSTLDDLIAPEDALEMRFAAFRPRAPAPCYAQRLEGVCLEIDDTSLEPSPIKVKYPPESQKFADRKFTPARRSPTKARNGTSSKNIA
jgi:hypothetical protein